MTEPEPPPEGVELWPGDEEDLARGPDQEEADREVDRSGLTDADLEPKPPSRLGRRLRFLSGAQIALIILALIFVVPLILAVVLSPVINFLSHT